KLIKIHDSPIECNEITVKKKLRRLGEETFFDLVELQRADNLAQSGEFRFRQENFDYLEKTAKEILKENECFSLRSLCVNGNDMIALGFCGKEIGKILDFLVEAVIEKEAENERDALLSLAKSEKERIRQGT
ncbi:MAG: tRNA nucleotidyltransferase, partial [Clostridia bacterium]|nr:tRNA nucleotidyltransferase [Clostridia bacterium]